MGFQENDSYIWKLAVDLDRVDTDQVMVILSSIVFEIIVPANRTKCKLLIFDD